MPHIHNLQLHEQVVRFILVILFSVPCVFAVVTTPEGLAVSATADVAVAIAAAASSLPTCTSRGPKPKPKPMPTPKLDAKERKTLVAKHDKAQDRICTLALEYFRIKEHVTKNKLDWLHEPDKTTKDNERTLATAFQPCLVGSSSDSYMPHCLTGSIKRSVVRLRYNACATQLVKQISKMKIAEREIPELVSGRCEDIQRWMQPDGDRDTRVNTLLARTPSTKGVQEHTKIL